MKAKTKYCHELLNSRLTVMLALQRVYTEIDDKIPEDFNVQPVICGDHIDFDFPTHEEFVAIMGFLGLGKWKKTYNENNITYTNTYKGVVINCYQTNPPPSCQLVKEEILVPEKITPAHTETRYKLICNEGDEV